MTQSWIRKFHIEKNYEGSSQLTNVFKVSSNWVWMQKMAILLWFCRTWQIHFHIVQALFDTWIKVLHNHYEVVLHMLMSYLTSILVYLYAFNTMRGWYCNFCLWLEVKIKETETWNWACWICNEVLEKVENNALWNLLYCLMIVNANPIPSSKKISMHAFFTLLRYFYIILRNITLFLVIS